MGEGIDMMTHTFKQAYEVMPFVYVIRSDTEATINPFGEETHIS